MRHYVINMCLNTAFNAGPVLIPCPYCENGITHSEYGEFDQMVAIQTCEVCDGSGKIDPSRIPNCNNCHFYIAENIANEFDAVGNPYDGFCKILDYAICDSNGEDWCWKYAPK